jgi:tRNA A-37 threonylcarbamoyl transferase component Bud32
MDIDRDLREISSLMRMHIEIRNRSFMKQVHRDCFIGSDAVEFLVAQGFAESRKQAVEYGQRMIDRSLIRNVTGKRRRFADAYLYYRFQEDDEESACLSPNHAGNGSGTYLGQGGCKFSFCPHTVHNSYIMDIALAEEIERAVAGASIESRARAIGKLRARVREQASDDALDWSLVQSTSVNKVAVKIYQRKRPRGDFNNVKMTGIVGDTAKGFIKGIMSFETRKTWESMFEDGFIVEAIDVGEGRSPILVEADEEITTSPKTVPETTVPTTTPVLLESVQVPSNLARKTDDVVAFLTTVDLAGIPAGMPIAFLNDPERQHALAHLRKQMMLSNPQECMLCAELFASSGDIRFCPCCAMVSCGSCVSKRVFEVVSRQVVSVCIHCYRSSSRIRHPPQAVQDCSAIDEAVRGKWWRPEELGMVDYSQSMIMASNQADRKPLLSSGVNLDELDETSATALSTATTNEPPSIEDDEEEDEESQVVGGSRPENNGDGIGLGVNESEYVSDESSAVAGAPPIDVAATLVASTKTARCKSCGLMISRDIAAIEAHMEECLGSSSRGRMSSMAFEENSLHSYKYLQKNANVDSNLAATGTRVIYRTARKPNSKAHAPREVCALQDSFIDEDGTCYMYEVSVRHCDIRGIAGYVTADVMLLMYVAKPISANAAAITIISQVDTRGKGSQWLLSFITEDSSLGNDIGMLRRDDLIRELKACGNLPNILGSNSPSAAVDAQPEEDEDVKVTLEDFDLLAVLGRGGFGKVMQVRHRPSGQVYAMKILKKTELRRRRQVERTQTEKSILAAIRHPFIVALHYAFQNPQKLYMVMDFVQGGDFFTLMRKFRRLPEDWVRYYVCEIAMALQHLHDKDIVYRDLKPENILLDHDGHIKLTDFGLSRFFETRPPATEDILGDDHYDVITRSFCGTEQYMSPEMLLQQGHNYRMDWWCLGLLMHEMISARHPFQGPTHYDTLRNMVTKTPNIDARLSPAAATVVKGFLNKNPKGRDEIDKLPINFSDAST